MATREKWLEAGGGGGLPMTSFNVEAFLGRLKCLFLRRFERLILTLLGKAGEETTHKADFKQDSLNYNRRSLVPRDDKQ